MTSEVYLMDCMEGMAKYPDKYFDLAVVDPPYGIDRFKNVTKNPSSKDVHAKTFQRMDIVNNEKPEEDYFKELFRVSNHQIIWGANNFELPTSEYFLIWDKKQSMPNFARCELAWVSMSMKMPAKIFEYSIHQHNKSHKIHPTQKPVSLYDWIFANYAEPCFKILDTHLGSGSSRIAAHKAKLDFVGFEIDQEYFEAAEKRYNDFIAQLTLF